MSSTSLSARLFRSGFFERLSAAARSVPWMLLARVLLSFVPLAAMVIWLASAERVLSVELVWNDQAKAICVQNQDCAHAVIAIESQGLRLPLDADLLLDAGHFLPTHERRDSYNERHRQLAQMLSTDEARLVLADHSTVPISVQARGLATLGYIWWVHVALAGLVWVSGWVHARRRPGMGSIFLALASSAFAIAMLLGGLELSHGLAWAAGAAGAINQAARAFVQLSFSFFLGFVLCLPHRVCPPRVVLALPVAALAIIAVDFFALAPAPMWGHQAFMLVWSALIPWAMAYQWKHTRSPLLRALAQWFGLGALLLLFRFAVIRWLADGDVADREVFVAVSFMAVKVYSAVVMLVIPVLGWAESTLRRMFLWMLAAGLLLVTDIFMVLVLRLNTEAALLASLLLVGAAYIPLRTWTFATLLGHKPVRLDQHIEAVYATARAASVSHERALQSWTALLEEVFSPEHIRTDERNETNAKLLEQGAALWAPLPVVGRGATLQHARGGRHLFSEADRQFANHCASLIGRLVKSDQAAEVARMQERERLANDLHDDLGGRLLHLARFGPPGPWQDYAQDTLLEMRLLAHGMSKGPVCLADLLADMRGEFVPRIQACARQAHWETQNDTLTTELMLSPQAALALTRILSESLRNGLQVPISTYVAVKISSHDNSLHFAIENDGATTHPSTWRQGLGMRSIQRRAQQLGGEARWSAATASTVILTVTLPLVHLVGNK